MAKRVSSLTKQERKQRRRRIACSFVVIWLLNVFSFVFMHSLPMNRRAILVPAREGAQSHVVHYVLAGTLNQSEAVFAQFLPEFEGTVVYVNFVTHGWDPEVVATQIAEDIEDRQAEARIWALSVSSQVAHLVDTKANNVKIVAINPCTTADCLAEQLRGYNWLAHLLRGVGYSLGWISALPLVPTVGSDTNTDTGRQNYSLILLLDQLVATTGGISQPGPYKADFVIISSRDQLLDVEAQRALYGSSARQIYTIEADHAGTTVYADAYREAFRASGLMK